jgi:hypothetical protein
MEDLTEDEQIARAIEMSLQNEGSTEQVSYLSVVVITITHIISLSLSLFRRPIL